MNLKKKILERTQEISKSYYISINEEKLKKMEDKFQDFNDYVCFCSGVFSKNLCPCDDLNVMLKNNGYCKCGLVQVELK
jgi:hypothetical protein